MRAVAEREFCGRGKEERSVWLFGFGVDGLRGHDSSERALCQYCEMVRLDASWRMGTLVFGATYEA